MSREISQYRIRDIAKRHRPKGWRVQESRKRWASSSGSAHWEHRTLYVPTLCDLDGLFIYMHEVGHVKQNHFNLRLPAHREEYEAERYALHIFRNEGLPVTRDMLDTARSRLRGVIDRDIKHKVPIQRHIARWAKHGG